MTSLLMCSAQSARQPWRATTALVRPPPTPPPPLHGERPQCCMRCKLGGAIGERLHPECCRRLVEQRAEQRLRHPQLTLGAPLPKTKRCAPAASTPRNGSAPSSVRFNSKACVQPHLLLLPCCAKPCSVPCLHLQLVLHGCNTVPPPAAAEKRGHQHIDEKLHTLPGSHGACFKAPEGGVGRGGKSC